MGREFAMRNKENDGARVRHEKEESDGARVRYEK